jgi:hypothetical protein
MDPPRVDFQRLPEIRDVPDLAIGLVGLRFGTRE